MNLNSLIVGLCALGALILLGQVVAVAFKAYRQRFKDTAQSRLEEAFVFMDTGKLFTYQVLGIVLIPLVVWVITRSIVMAVIAAVVAFAFPRISFSFINKRRRMKIVQQLPDVLVLLGSSMRAGTSLQIALDIAIRETPEPLSQELGVVVREQRLGLALEDALESMAARLKLDEVELVVAAITIARDVGGNLAETFDRLATTLRAKATMEGKIRSLTSQGKLQGLIVGSLPLFLMLVLNFLQPAEMRPLFNSVIGWGVLGVIAILEFLGFMMIKKIVTIDV